MSSDVRFPSAPQLRQLFVKAYNPSRDGALHLSDLYTHLARNLAGRHYTPAVLCDAFLGAGSAHSIMHDLTDAQIAEILTIMQESLIPAALPSPDHEEEARLQWERAT